MRNLFVFVALFLGITFSSFSQNNINITFNSVKGKIVFESDGTYTSNFTVLGLNNETEVQNFKSTILANKNVKSLQVFKTGSESDARKVTAILLSNNAENKEAFIKSLPYKTLTIDGKSYTKDQFEQMKADFKASKQARNSDISKDKQ
jgi:hypothetical protein